MAQRPIRPQWLLRQADELGYRSGGPGQPRNINLRRAASAAYYALFHALAMAMARSLLPDGSDKELAQLCRSVNHEALRLVCLWVTQKGGPPEHAADIVDGIRNESDLVDIADAFVELRDVRHDADYDHLADFTKAGVLGNIDSARDACAKLEHLVDTGSPALRRFLSLVSLRTSIR